MRGWREISLQPHPLSPQSVSQSVRAESILVHADAARNQFGFQNDVHQCINGEQEKSEFGFSQTCCPQESRFISAMSI